MAAVCGLVLESYLQLHKALTKDSDKVQAVTPIEECYYKVQDLKQVQLSSRATTGVPGSLPMLSDKRSSTQLWVKLAAEVCPVPIPWVC